MKMFLVVCNREKALLAKGCTLSQIYGGMLRAYERPEDAQLAAQQLNELSIQGERYTVVEKKMR